MGTERDFGPMNEEERIKAIGSIISGLEQAIEYLENEYPNAVPERQRDIEREIKQHRDTIAEYGRML